MYFSEAFFGNSVTPISTLANNKDPALKNGKFQAKLAFFYMFPAKKLSHCSRLSRTTTGPTRPIRPRPIGCDLRSGTRTNGDFFPGFCPFFCSSIAIFSTGTRSSADQHPKISPYSDFRDRGVIFHATNGGKKNTTTSSPRREKIFFWPAFVTRILTPRSRKSGYGLLLGCRSPLDAGSFEKTLVLTMFEPQNRENLHRPLCSGIAIDRAWSN